MGGSSTASYCLTTPGGTGSCFNIRGGVYGTLGTPATGNIPGARTGAVSWTDTSGNLWLFGGGGFDAVGNHNLLNDLWEFSPATNEWTWMGGASTLPGNNQVAPGVYGTLGSPAAANIPGGRSGAAGWADTSGKLWLFGGSGYPPTGNTNGPLNDLWRFDPATVEWTWMGGSSAIDQPGVYSALQTPAAGNIPGGRLGALSWTDRQGNLWLFAGDGIDAQGKGGVLNDFWEFSPSTSLWAWMGGSSTVGSCFTGDGKGNYGILNDVWEYQSGSAIGQPAPDFSVNASPGSFTVAAGQSVTAIISITPANGFSSAVSFSCSGLPSGATCSFSPQTATPPGKTSTTLTVTTSATSAILQHGSSPLFPGTALAVGLCCFVWKKRRRLPMLLVLAVTAAGLFLIDGCGSSGSPFEGSGGTQPIAATVTVTATSGSLQHSTTFSLTVN
jgi:hypothetical protein